MKEDCQRIGSFVKVHGIKGELILEADHSLFLENIGESIFVEIDGQLIPFFIENSGAVNLPDRVRLKLLWVNNEKEAEYLNKRDVYLHSNDIETSEEAEDVETINLFRGFKVHDRVHGNIGELEDIIDEKVNPLLVVIKDRKEILIPLQADIVRRIDRKMKTIYISAPEGLIDLYLE